MSVQVAPPAAGTVQALFKEARRRRRRRWLAGTAAVLVVAIAVAVSAVSWPGPPAGHGSGGVRPAGPAQAVSSSVALVWFDGTSLRVGYLQPGGAVSEHAVAEVNAHDLPLVPAGGRVYWVDPAGTFVPALGHWSQVVRYLDVATGTIGIAGAGQTVFLSADGRELFMSQTATTLTETPVTGPRCPRRAAGPCRAATASPTCSAAPASRPRTASWSSRSPTRPRRAWSSPCGTRPAARWRASDGASAAF